MTDARKEAVEREIERESVRHAELVLKAQITGDWYRADKKAAFIDKLRAELRGEGDGDGN